MPAPSASPMPNIDPRSLSLWGEWQIACRAALAAGEILLRMRHQGVTGTRKLDSTWISEADMQSAFCIDTYLHTAFPQDAVLNEETHLSAKNEAPAISMSTTTAMSAVQPQSRAYAPRLWMIDPLDSTSSYLRGQPFYAVLIALCIEGKPVLGVTYRPEQGELAWAIAGSGAWRTFTENAILDGAEAEMRALWKMAQPLRVRATEDMDFVTSHGRFTPGLSALLHRLGSPPTRPMNGSMKIVEVARGAATVFLSPRENALCLWDIAAPQIILHEAGGELTDLQGKPYAFTANPSPLEGGILATNRLLHKYVMQKLTGPA